MKEILTREQFIELMGFEEGDEGLAISDEEHKDGTDYFIIARETIKQLNYMLSDAFSSRWIDVWDEYLGEWQ